MSTAQWRSERLSVFEVFLQKNHNSPLGHVGSLLAADNRQAWRLARETFARRDDAVRMWVVRRSDVYTTRSTGRPLLDGRSRMPYRLPAYPQQRRRSRGRPDARAEETLPRPTVRGASGVELIWLAVADDLFLHAHRLAKQITDYTELEEALAVGSIAQEDLSHARTILELLDFTREAADGHFFDRPAAAWSPSRLTSRAEDDRIWSVVRGLVVAAGTAALASCAVDLLRADDFAPEAESRGTRDSLEAIANEQRLHLAHWSARAARYAKSPRSPELTEAWSRALDCAAEFFGTPAGPEGSTALLPVPSPAALADEVERLLDDSLPPDLRVPVSWRTTSRAGGDLHEDLPGVLDELRAVRTRYPQGAFL